MCRGRGPPACEHVPPLTNLAPAMGQILETSTALAEDNTMFQRRRVHEGTASPAGQYLLGGRQNLGLPSQIALGTVKGPITRSLVSNDYRNPDKASKHSEPKKKETCTRKNEAEGRKPKRSHPAETFCKPKSIYFYFFFLNYKSSFGS